jgi:hypothetical protein
MPARRAAALALAALVALGLAGCGEEKEKGIEAAQAAPAAAPAAGPTTTSSSCQQPPAAQPNVAWFPADLPLPPGTYTAQEVEVSAPSKGVILVVPVTIREYVTFALAELPKQGWRLGKGDSEANEAEDTFTKGTAGGSFRVRSVYCDTSKSELRIVYRAA